MNSVSVGAMLSQLAAAGIDYRYDGDDSLVVSSAKRLDDSGEGSISFYRGRDVRVAGDLALKGCFLILHREVFDALSRKGSCVGVVNPDLAFCIMAQMLCHQETPSIHPTAFVDPDAVVGKMVRIGAGSFIGPEVSIGDETVIAENVVLKNCELGANCHIHPGVKIGSSGLGSHRDDEGNWHQFPHFGRVKIGNRVIVQDNTVIARGTLSDTTIADGVSIGPLCGIAHGVSIAEHVLISQSTIVAGSSVIERNATIWGNVSIRDGVRVGLGAVVGIGAVVVKNVDPGAIVMGNPAGTHPRS